MTDDRRARDSRYERLLEVTRALGEQTDLDGLLQTIVHQTSHIVAVERTSLFIFDEKSGTLWSRVAEGMDSKQITIPITQGLAGAAAQTRLAVRVDDVYSDPRFDQSVDVRTGFRTRSALCVPILGDHQNLLGVLQAINARAGAFTDEDEQLLGALASQVSVAIVRAQLIERQMEHQRLERALEIAKDVQLGMLPDLDDSQAAFPSLELGGVMIPALTVGGDFFDAFELSDGRLAMVIGDVSGKGMSAAMMMARSITLIRALAAFDSDPAKIMNAVNYQLATRNEADMFITAFMAFLDPATGDIEYVNAGHNPPLLVSADGRVDHLGGTGNLPLAAWDDTEYPKLTARVEHGLFLYTDGVTEAVDPNDEEFGEARTDKLLAEIEFKPRDLCARIVDVVNEFAEGLPQADDLTMLAVLRTG